MRIRGLGTPSFNSAHSALSVRCSHAHQNAFSTSLCPMMVGQPSCWCDTRRFDHCIHHLPAQAFERTYITKPQKSEVTRSYSKEVLQTFLMENPPNMCQNEATVTTMHIHLLVTVRSERFFSFATSSQVHLSSDSDY